MIKLLHDAVDHPKYNYSDVQKFLKNRYECNQIPIRYTLERLNLNQSFKNTIQKLRGEGYLDWQLLGVIAGITVTERVYQKLGHKQADPMILKNMFSQLYFIPESENDITIPINMFSEDIIRERLPLLMLSSLPILGLELHQRVPDFKAIQYFLKKRFNYFSDDIEHEDPLQ